MKIRNGFVSNSSSSSFVILGTSLSKINSISEKRYDYEDVDELATKLTYHSGISEYYEDIIIGKDPSYLDENKTIKESKKIIADLINESFNVNLTEKDISFYVDGGYDG